MPAGHEQRMQLVLDNRSVDLRRRVGANAWVVLEVLLLSAAIDEPERATCRATVRALQTGQASRKTPLPGRCNVSAEPTG